MADPVATSSLLATLLGAIGIDGSKYFNLPPIKDLRG
jgi:hypothetical protein